VSRVRRVRSYRCPARHRATLRVRVLRPVNVRLPRGCCEGWFFAHTTDCPTPAVPRPCSDCDAEPGTDHAYHCQWWWD